MDWTKFRVGPMTGGGGGHRHRELIFDRPGRKLPVPNERWRANAAKLETETHLDQLKRLLGARG